MYDKKSLSGLNSENSIHVLYNYVPHPSLTSCYLSAFFYRSPRRDSPLQPDQVLQSSSVFKQLKHRDLNTFSTTELEKTYEKQQIKDKQQVFHAFQAALNHLALCTIFVFALK